MNEVRLDASAWKTRDDFYDAILPALGAPEWHGRNLDALWDSINCDDINELRLPIRLVLVGSGTVSSDLRAHLQQFARLIVDCQNDGQDVTLICDPPL